MVEIRRVHADTQIGRGLYGARKVWQELRHEAARGEPVAELGPIPRCQVERLDAPRGAARGTPGPAVHHHPPRRHGRPPADLVRRDFTADPPEPAVGGRFHLRGDLVTAWCTPRS